MKQRPQQLMLLLLLLWLAFGLRLYRLDFQSIWWDEGHSIFVAEHPISQIPTLPAMDVHPPAYFALLHAWMRLAGDSEFALRYLSVLFGLLTIALLARFAADIARQLRGAAAHAGWLTALLAALSPLYVAYSQEVRSYTMITFLALASTYILWRLVFCSTRGRRGLLLYSVSVAACLYTHYFTIFLLLFHNLVWLAWTARRPGNGLRRRVVWWLAGQVGALALFAPQLALTLRQVTAYANPNLQPPTLAYFLSRSWQAYTIGLTIDPTPAWWGMLAIATVLILGWALLLLANSSPASPSPTPHISIPHPPSPISHLLFLTTWIALPLTAYYLILQQRPSFEPRYLMLITPALFLLLGLPPALARIPGHRLALYGLTVLPLVAMLVGLRSYFTDETYFKDDSAGVARWLAAETTSNDIIYIDVPHPFHYYTKKMNIPAPTRYLFVDIHTAADILNREAAGRNRLFWVTWWGSDTDPRGVIPFLGEKYGQQLGQREFRGYRVTWFSLPPAGTTIRLPEDLPPVEAVFGDVLRLDGAAFGGAPPETTTLPRGESAWAVLHFTLLRNTGVNYRVSLRLRGEDGRLVSQVDKDLLNDRHFRTAAWPLDVPALNQALNVYLLPVPPDAPPGDYRLEAVLYNAEPPYPSEGVFGPHAAPDATSAALGYLTVLP